MFSSFYVPLHQQAYKIKQSATLIDNINSNISKCDISTGIFFTDSTEHFPIFYIDYSVSVPCEPSFMLTRHHDIKMWQNSQQN